MSAAEQDRLTLRRHTGASQTAPLARKSLSAQVALERRIVDGCDQLEQLLDRRHSQQHKDLRAIRNLAIQHIDDIEADLRGANDVDAAHVNGGPSADAMPVICVNTKLCTQLDLAGTLRAYAEQQWKLDTEPWADAFEDLDAAREKMRLATGEWSAGPALAYHALLQAIQNRFFLHGHNGSVLFKWHDAINGEESLELSVIHEQASVLFNAGALYMQHAALQDRTTDTGLRLALHDFEAAAGIFRHLLKKRLVSTSLDLSQTMLAMLCSVCLAQAQECLWRLASSDGTVPPGPEAALVSRLYGMARFKMQQPEIYARVPALWVQQAKFKMLFFEGISHLLVGQAGGLVGDGTVNEASIMTSLLHLRHAHNLFNEAASHARVFLEDCPGLICAATAYLTQTTTRINAAEAILFVGRTAGKNKKAYKRALELAAKQHRQSELLPSTPKGGNGRRASLESARTGVVPLVPYIWGQARVNATAVDPGLLDVPRDPFVGLGAALNAGVAISARRSHFLHAKDYAGDWDSLGIVLAGDGATVVESVVADGVAALAGFVPGMIVASVGDRDVMCQGQPVVQALIDATFYSQGWTEIGVLLPFKDFDVDEIFESGAPSPAGSTGAATPVVGITRSATIASRGSSFKHVLLSGSRRGTSSSTGTNTSVLVAC